MSQLNKEDVVFNATELSMAEELKNIIIETVRGKLQIDNFNVSVKISMDENDKVMWGQVFVDSEVDESVWPVVDNAKENFAHGHGFPETLISVLPV